LALDDLVTFAVHARRLIQNTLGKKSFASVDVPQLAPLHGSVAITEVIDALIHNEDIDVVRSFFHYSLVSDPPVNLDDAIDRLAKQESGPGRIPPIVAVKSDRGLRCVVSVSDLTEVFETKILEKIIEYCVEDRLFLEDEYRDI